MAELSRHLMKEFATLTTGDKKPEVSNTVRGTVVVDGENKYVAIDGSSVNTPISEIIDARQGDRVLVTIENHVATVVGNISKPPSAYKEQEAITRITDTSRDLSSQITEVRTNTETKVEELKTKVDSIGNVSDLSAVDSRITAAENKATEAATKADAAKTELEKQKELQAAQAKALEDQMLITKQELEANAALATAKEFDEKFKALMEANDKDRKQAERDLITMAARMELIQANLENMTAVWNAIDTAMKFSNEGLAIGERSGDSYILVKPNRISMFSAGSEVMYIANGVIHIDNGVFTLSLQIGYYVESQYEYNPKYNVVRYVGPK